MCLLNRTHHIWVQNPKVFSNVQYCNEMAELEDSDGRLNFAAVRGTINYLMYRQLGKVLGIIGMYHISLT